MGVDYSYTQPSLSEDYGLGDSAHSAFSQTEAEFEAAILQDQAEIEASRVEYPPQPEVEFGFPNECYCGAIPALATSYTRNDPGRRIKSNISKHNNTNKCHKTNKYKGSHVLVWF
ncbi:hypothetical protein Bca52824_007830 [Brassica carinata]|uniref:Uncharacterized protein n=1 Tax=Brassica carinata TaxID=52824 RepID=A0A8X8B884_BRACI|nr:hypothetical protein Bca52824_007830 [Brassica carinata]